MITWPDLLADLKKSTNTEHFDNIPDELYYKWLSKAHSTIAEYLKAQIDSKFFMAISQADLVAWQNVYDNLWKDDTTWLYINVIDSLYIKYDWEKFTKASIQDLSELPESREYYEENQPKEKPFYVATWQKILIFPKPDLDVPNWIELIWSRNVWEINENTTQEQIFNWKIQEIQYIDLIVKGARQYVYQHTWEKQLESNEKNEFIYQDLPRLKAELSFRWSQPVEYEEDSSILELLS